MAKPNQAPADTTPAAEAAAPATAPAVPVDQWHGMGGEYVVENGVRRRVAGPPVGPETPADA